MISFISPLKNAERMRITEAIMYRKDTRIRGDNWVSPILTRYMMTTRETLQRELPLEQSDDFDPTIFPLSNYGSVFLISLIKNYR